MDNHFNLKWAVSPPNDVHQALVNPMGSFVHFQALQGGNGETESLKVDGGEILVIVIETIFEICFIQEVSFVTPKIHIYIHPCI